MESKRIFLGVPFDYTNQYYNTLSDLVSDLQVRVSITSLENYHLTTHYFGDVDLYELEKIQNSFENFNFKPFPLTLGTPSYLPHLTPHKARVLYIQPTEGVNYLETLQQNHVDIVQSIGFQISRRKFLPHLTIGRIRGGRDVRKLVQRWTELEFMDIQIEINQFKLYESVSTSSGRKYNPIITVNSEG